MCKLNLKTCNRSLCSLNWIDHLVGFGGRIDSSKIKWHLILGQKVNGNIINDAYCIMANVAQSLPLCCCGMKMFVALLPSLAIWRYYKHLHPMDMAGSELWPVVAQPDKHYTYHQNFSPRRLTNNDQVSKIFVHELVYVFEL